MSGTGEIEQRQARVRILTAHHEIEGDLTLPREGYRSRVSDFLNAAERGPFLSVSDVEVKPLDGGAPEHHRFLAVSRTQIVFVVELEGSAQGGTNANAAASGPLAPA